MSTRYKLMSQKYEIDSGKPPCKKSKSDEFSCQQIPLSPYKKPRYNLPPQAPVPFTKEFYTSSAVQSNTCQYVKGLDESCPPLASCNQKAPYYHLGPHINLSDPPVYVYTMPNQKLVYGAPVPIIDLKKMPWYGSYGWQ